MSLPGQQGRMGWGARLLIAFALVLAGAAAATWGLARNERAARLLGVADSSAPTITKQAASARPALIRNQQPARSSGADGDSEQARIAALEQRLGQLEHATERAEGSAGRADNLLIAAAARRAIDRGVSLGYLERLLTERFGERHPAAVATVITGARDPVRLNDLIAGYEALGPELRRGGPSDDWWTEFKRELGSVVQVHSAKRPSLAPDVRYQRALRRLQSGDVDEALAETMRLPGAGHAGEWVGQARRYIAVHRGLDEIESAALMPRPAA